MATVSSKLIFNEAADTHLSVLSSALPQATYLECVVAFAKKSGFKALEKDLKSALTKGLKARFTVGLSFCHTDPVFLTDILALTKKHDVELYMSAEGSATFHPKIYALARKNGYRVIIGSANFTSGGFEANYEASAVLDTADATVLKEVKAYVDKLIRRKDVVLATPELIEAYSLKHEINAVFQAKARKAATSAMSRKGRSTNTLQAKLELMRDDPTKHGFTASMVERRQNRRQALTAMRALSRARPRTATQFMPLYEALIDNFHSGGLHRNKPSVATGYKDFQAAMKIIGALSSLSPDKAYDALLSHLSTVNGAGVNVITEILMSVDSRKFANMNQAAVHGMRLANFTEFPPHPDKKKVDGKQYAEYCAKAAEVRKALGLKDFIELDALFNYAYWNRGAR